MKTSFVLYWGNIFRTEAKKLETLFNEVSCKNFWLDLEYEFIENGLSVEETRSLISKMKEIKPKIRVKRTLV